MTRSIARPPPELRDRSFQVTTSLPADLLHQAGRRVQIVGFVFAAVWALVAVLNEITFRVAGGPLEFSGTWARYGLPISGGAVALSLGTALLARGWVNEPHRVLRLGLALEILTAAAIAFLTEWEAPLVGRGVSWVCVVILLFPAILPLPPSTILGTSLVAAVMDPIFHSLAVWAGASPPAPTVVQLWMFTPNFICAALSTIPAGIVRSLGRAVREARELGNYRLETLLGKGGMGEVYRASHRLLARPAAVKLISLEHLGGGGRGETRGGAAAGPGADLVSERFRREAASAAGLRSPHTIELYDFGVADDGTLYYAMELLDGINLQVLVERFGPLPPARVIHLLRQACLSLAEAHRKGLIHRDIKPSNLMISRMGTQVDYLKVLDFGLVKVEAPSDATLTAPDVTAGTPAFLPPEAIEGVRDLTPAADIYALGCVAYWLLAGRLVFDGPTPIAILVKHGREQPARLPGCPPDLEAVVFQCLDKTPTRRPDAQRLERMLDACGDAGGWSREHAERWWADHLTEAAT